MTKRSAASPAMAWLRDRKLRITKGRLSLLQILRQATAPLTLAELQARAKNCDFATVFRFIGLLEGKKLVQRHTWDDRQIRYELSEDEHHDHHHHLICRVCRQVETVDHCLIERMQTALMKERGYRELTHSLEFFGLCPKCQKRNARSSHHRH